MSDQHTKCDKENLVHQLLKVQAEVTITPLVTHGPPKVCCIDSEIKPDFDCDKWTELKEANGKCSFTLTQIFCVEIPIELDVDVAIDKGIIGCGKPDFGPCKTPCKKPPCNPPHKPPITEPDDTGVIPTDDIEPIPPDDLIKEY